MSFIVREVGAKLIYRKGEELLRPAAVCCAGPVQSCVLQVSAYVAVCD